MKTKFDAVPLLDLSFLDEHPGAERGPEAAGAAQASPEMPPPTAVAPAPQLRRGPTDPMPWGRSPETDVSS